MTIVQKQKTLQCATKPSNKRKQQTDKLLSSEFKATKSCSRQSFWGSLFHIVQYVLHKTTECVSSSDSGGKKVKARPERSGLHMIDGDQMYIGP